MNDLNDSSHLIIKPKLVFLIFTIIVAAQLPIGWLIHNISLPISIIINQVGVMFCVPLLIIIKLFGVKNIRLPFKKLNIHLFFTLAISALLLAMITDYLLAATEYVLTVPESLHAGMERLMAATTPKEYIIKLILLALLPSICEEILFRGIFQTSLVARYGKVVGIVVAAALFAAAHINPWYIHLYFMLGLFLGWTYEKSRTLWIPIICHFANNLWTLTNSFFEIKFPIGNLKIDVVLILSASILFYLFIRQSTRFTTSDNA